MTLRKNISITKNEYDLISSFAIKNGYTFSELLRESTLKLIKQEEEMNLLEYLNKTCEYVSEEEQKEIDSLNINFDDLSGEELRIENVL